MQNFSKFNFLFYVECFFQELGETKKAPQHDTQLNPAPSPNWPEAAIAGPSGVSLLNPLERPQDDPLISGNSCWDNPTYALPKSNGDQPLREVAQTLMCQVCKGRIQVFSTGELAGNLRVRLQNEWDMFPNCYNLRTGTHLKTGSLEIPAMPQVTMRYMSRGSQGTKHSVAMYFIKCIVKLTF